MTHVAWALLIFAFVQAAAMVTLLVGRARRISAEQTLRGSEERLRLLDRAPAMFWTARPDTTLDYVNKRCVDFTGMSVEELKNEGWLGAVHPEDRAQLVATYTPAVEAREPFLAEYRMRRADGAWRWILATGVPNHARDGSYAGFLGVDVDITDRKEGEDRIRAGQAALEASHREVQRLAGRLIETQDAERARIARDLHDDVSQQLAGMSIAISSLKHRMDELHVAEEVQSELRSLHQRTTTLAHNVRGLSHDLHPTVLRHAGLVASLATHCADVQRTHGTTITCSAEGDLGSLTPEVALSLYRIAQEAVRNVIAHAGARRADVRLLCIDEHAEITIVDDGRGFDVTRSRERSTGLGLVSIAERIRLLGGTVSVVSEPDRGTQVSVRVPARRRENSNADTEGGHRELEVR